VNPKKRFGRARVLDRDLSPGIRTLLRELRKDLDRYGWRVYVENSGKQFSIEFRNPLSPLVSGVVFDRGRQVSDIRDEIIAHIRDEPEFNQTRVTPLPARKRDLIGRIRWAGTSYGWSNATFEQVVDTMHAIGVLANDELTWAKKAGPASLPDEVRQDWQRHLQ